MMTIRKYTIPFAPMAPQELPLHSSADILHVMGTGIDKIGIWAEVDTDDEPSLSTVMLVTSGVDICDWEHVATFPHGSDVLHLMRLIPEPDERFFIMFSARTDNELEANALKAALDHLGKDFKGTNPSINMFDNEEA